MYFSETQYTGPDGHRITANQLAEQLTAHLELRDGFRGSYVGNDGPDWRIVTLWRREEHHRALAESDDGRSIARVLAEAGLTEVDSVAYSDAAVIEPHVEELRLIQATVVPGDIERVMQYWRERGRELNEEAPGCVRAEAFLHEKESQLHFAIWWRTAAEATHFRYTDHLDGELARGFGNGFRSFGRYSMAPVPL